MHVWTFPVWGRSLSEVARWGNVHRICSISGQRGLIITSASSFSRIANLTALSSVEKLLVRIFRSLLLFYKRPQLLGVIINKHSIMSGRLQNELSVCCLLLIQLTFYLSLPTHHQNIIFLVRNYLIGSSSLKSRINILFLDCLVNWHIQIARHEFIGSWTRSRDSLRSMIGSDTFSTSQPWAISYLWIHLKIGLFLANSKNRHIRFTFVNNIWMPYALAMSCHPESFPCSCLPILVKYSHIFLRLIIL